jgi:hypothetical protein
MDWRWTGAGCDSFGSIFVNQFAVLHLPAADDAVAADAIEVERGWDDPESEAVMFPSRITAT